MIAMDRGFDKVLIVFENHDVVQAIQETVTSVSNFALINRGFNKMLIVFDNHEVVQAI